MLARLNNLVTHLGEAAHLRNRVRNQDIERDLPVTVIPAQAHDRGWTPDMLGAGDSPVVPTTVSDPAIARRNSVFDETPGGAAG